MLKKKRAHWDEDHHCQKNLERLLHFESKNPRTLEQFGEPGDEPERYMDREVFKEM